MIKKLDNSKDYVYCIHYKNIYKIANSVIIYTRKILPLLSVIWKVKINK